MENDHVASSSSSGSSDPEKNKQLDADESRDEVSEFPGTRNRRHHVHQLGKFKLRATEDDLPTDWWFASTAIPLIAATFAPMANLLSIAALVVSWRNIIVNDDPVLYQATSKGYPDPNWCINLNVASLVCGFVGNLFLLFNFTKRVRYIVALPSTIILFLAASGILTGITVAMNSHVPPGDGELYSQGYWYAIIASCLYLFNSIILLVNMGGYFLGHYPQHFTLSDEQRNLILQTMMFFIWLGGGAGVFSRIEGWSYPDALYFCDVTILTIGFGDFYVTSDLGRGLVFPYSVGGTIILGLMVSSIHKFAGELSSVNVLRKHVETRRVNTLSRIVSPDDHEEKRREDLEKKMTQMNGQRPQISAPLPNPLTQGNSDSSEHHIEFRDTSAEELKKQGEDSEPAPHQFFHSNFRKKPVLTTLRLITKPVQTMTRARSRTQKAIVMREEKDRFDAMRNIQLNARKFKKWYALCISTFAFGVLWCVGAVVFWQAERKTQQLSYFQSLYFCYVSLLTIGYGDLSPKSNAGKPFFVVWSLIAVPTMTILISDMGDTVISSFKRGTFKLGDLTVLPKAGLWHDFLKSHPFLWNWMSRRTERKRIKAGMPVGPGDTDGPLMPTIEELASDEPDEAEMTKRLAWAIRKTADDLHSHPGKRYTYEEWAEFTRLIRFTKIGVDQLDHNEELDGVVEWDWLEDNSPMMSSQSESEWILDRLCESLLRLLKKNQLGLGGTPGSAFTPTSSAFNFSRQGTMFDVDGADSTTPTKSKDKAALEVTPAQERRRRASGADALLTFFTGERRGAHTYVSDAPLWSKKAKERLKEKRRGSGGHARRGPFAKFEGHGRTGAVGGGRGGAGSRTLKMRHFVGDGEGHR